MLDIDAANAADLELYAEKTGYKVDPRQFNAIKASSKGKVLGIIGFDYWTPTALQMHVWIGNPMALRGGRWLHECFKYAFWTCGKKVAFGVIPSDNQKALDFIWNVGFVELIRLKDGWDSGVDMVINEIRPAQCRWLEERYSGNR